MSTYAGISKTARVSRCDSFITASRLQVQNAILDLVLYRCLTLKREQGVTASSCRFRNGPVSVPLPASDSWCR